MKIVAQIVGVDGLLVFLKKIKFCCNKYIQEDRQTKRGADKEMEGQRDRQTKRRTERKKEKRKKER